LIGAGSIGKKHLSLVSNKFNTVFVVDPDSEVEKYLLQLPNADRITYIHSLAKIKAPIPPKIAVVSNWGPDHYATFLDLVEMGIKNFVIEKPLTDSFYELDEMQKLVEQNQINLKTNTSLIYSALPKKLTSFEEKYSLGKPLAIYVYGGAKCIATIGIHYVALANCLFDSRPISVNASLKSDYINPRNKRLNYFEGNANWKYPDFRYLAINFVNSSQTDFKCTIIYKFAEVTLNGELFTLSRIPPNKLINLDKPTKTLATSEQILQISLSNLLFTQDKKSPLEVLYDEFHNDGNYQIKDLGFAATSDLLSAMVSSELGRTLKLPIDLSFIKELYYKKWNIS
jgi:predicted dehydrogenase